MLHPCQSKASKSKVRTRWSPHILSVCEWKIVDAKKKGELPLGMGLSWRSIIEKEGLTYLHSGFELDAFRISLMNCVAILQSFRKIIFILTLTNCNFDFFRIWKKHLTCVENMEELKALLCKTYDSSTSISPTRKVGSHICAYIQSPLLFWRNFGIIITFPWSYP